MKHQLSNIPREENQLSSKENCPIECHADFNGIMTPKVDDNSAHSQFRSEAVGPIAV
jgi:hypothetical protein